MKTFAEGAAHFVLTTLLCAAAVPACADTSYKVVNNSSLTVMELYTSGLDRGFWGEDLLYAHVLPPGRTASVTIADGTGQCAYTLRFVLEDGRDVVDIINICEATSYILEGAK